MTCGGCVASVKERLEAVPGVQKAAVQLDYPQLQLTTEHTPSTDALQRAAGKYQLTPVAAPTPVPAPAVAPAVSELPDVSVTTYKPLILIVAFLVGVTLLAQYPFTGGLDGMLWMRHFMAGFFLTFSFFKLLNLQGFAMSYAMYDIVAARWRPWGYIYPFVELGLGISYLINAAPFWTNLVTVVVLSVSAVGVIQSNLNKRKIKCACLGDVFNLPMSTVTIIEDVSMVAMALVMLLT